MYNSFMDNSNCNRSKHFLLSKGYKHPIFIHTYQLPSTLYFICACIPLSTGWRKVRREELRLLSPPIALLWLRRLDSEEESAAYYMFD